MGLHNGRVIRRSLFRAGLLLPALLMAAGLPAAVAAPPPAAAKLSLRIATGELPPYATAGRADGGLALAIVRRAFQLGGHAVEFHFMPWSRALAETREGLWDATAHWGATPERRRDFLLSDNLYTEQWQLLYRRGLYFDWQRVDDLGAYRLGLTQDYTYTPEIWAAARSGALRSEKLLSDLAGLRMLLAGRIDAMPLDRNVACDLLMRHFEPAARARVMLHPRPITDRFSTHVMFVPGRARSAEHLAAFNRGLQQLRSSGEYARMVSGSVPCPPHWSAP